MLKRFGIQHFVCQNRANHLISLVEVEMKIAIDRMNLLRPLSHINSVVERRNTIPILSNVVLHAASEKLSLTATDMDMDIITTTPCSISSEGATTIPAHLLFEIVKKLLDRDTTFPGFVLLFDFKIFEFKILRPLIKGN